MKLKKIALFTLVLSFFVFLVPCISLTANAQDKVDAAASVYSETPEGAQLMAEKAYEYFKSNGKEASLKAFNTDAAFKYKSLYVFAMDKKGVIIAHGEINNMVGKDLSRLRDPTGKLFAQEIVSVQDKGWVEYYWRNAIKNAMQKKKTYVINAGDFAICVGVYLDE